MDEVRESRYVGRPISVTLLDHAVIRVAAWPIEACEPFRAPELAAAADRLTRAEARALARRGPVVSALYAALPLISSRAARAWLLEQKRSVHRDSAPLPNPPHDVVTELGRHTRLATLLARERVLRRGLAARRAAFGRHYDAVLNEQRGELHRLAGEPPFERALCIAAPLVFERWRTCCARAAQRAPDRRIDATLFHYLMRAIGRPTPHGAWAGVAPVHPDARRHGSRLHVAPATTRYHVSVSLKPFEMIASSLAAEPTFRRRCPLRLNPTLVANGAGWTYQSSCDGRPTWRRLEWKPVAAAVVDFLRDGHACLAHDVTAIFAPHATSGGSRFEQAEQLVDALVESGVLQLDLSVPTGARNAWEALDVFVSKLPLPERNTFVDEVASIRRTCDRMAHEFATLTPDDIDRLRRSVEEAVTRLWHAGGMAGAPRGPLVYVDMRAPFSVSWSAEAIAVVTAAVRERLDFHAVDGLAESYRLMTVDQIVEACGPTGSASLLSLLGDRVTIERNASVIDDGGHVPVGDTRRLIFSRFPMTASLSGSLRAQEEEWTQRLASSHDAIELTIPSCRTRRPAFPASSGALLLSLGGDGRLHTGSGRPQPGLFVSRFADVLAPSSAVESPVVGGLRKALSRIGDATMTPAEVVISDPANANAALRPLLTRAVLDPRGTASANLQGVRVIADKPGGRVWLRRGHDGNEIDLCPIYNSGAAGIGTDACSAFLVLMAFAQGWEAVSFGFPSLEAEATWRHLPRLLLPSGAVLSARRWTLTRDAIEEVLAGRGATQFQRWRTLAGELGLPPLLFVKCGSRATDLLLPTDSPLAVSCLFDTIGVRAPWMVLTEIPADMHGWPVVDEAGQHYLSEIGVTWFAHTKDDTTGDEPWDPNIDAT